MPVYNAATNGGAQWTFKAEPRDDASLPTFVGWSWAALRRDMNGAPSGIYRVFRLDGSRADWWAPVCTEYR